MKGLTLLSGNVTRVSGKMIRKKIIIKMYGKKRRKLE